MKCGLGGDVVRGEPGRVLLAAEAHTDEAVRAALAPAETAWPTRCANKDLLPRSTRPPPLGSAVGSTTLREASSRMRAASCSGATTVAHNRAPAYRWWMSSEGALGTTYGRPSEWADPAKTGWSPQGWFAAAVELTLTSLQRHLQVCALHAPEVQHLRGGVSFRNLRSSSSGAQRSTVSPYQGCALTD
jgi:hypothetical protein